MIRVGSAQHRWLYGGPDPWECRPFQFSHSQGSPPSVLRNLIQKGWMWAEKRETRKWMPRKQQWGIAEPGAEFWCGLTDKGRVVIELRRGRKHICERCHGDVTVQYAEALEAMLKKGTPFTVQMGSRAVRVDAGLLCPHCGSLTKGQPAD